MNVSAREVEILVDEVEKNKSIKSCPCPLHPTPRYRVLGEMVHITESQQDLTRTTQRRGDTDGDQ